MNEKITSTNIIAEKIIELEKKYQLFELEIKDIYFWKLLRQPLLTEILLRDRKINQIQIKTSKIKIVKSSFSILVNSILRNPFFKKTKKTWIFENPRKIYQENRWIDPYTHFYIGDNHFKDFTLFESRYNGELKKSVWSSNTNLDFIYALNIFKRRINKEIIIPKNIKEVINKIENEIKESFNVDINLIQNLRKEIKSFQSAYQINNRLIKYKKPKEIVLICSYGKEALIAAAQKNNVKVIEIQHGFISSNHLGYNFPVNEKNQIKYFPDELWMFGEYWLRSIQLPIETNVRIMGYPYLTKTKQRKNKTKKKYNMFISQGTIGKYLSKIALKVAKLMPEEEFVYKLHPGEFTRWKKDYPELVEFEKLPNTIIIENEISVYELFNKTKTVMGVNSTLIFEAIYFKIFPLIIKLPGYEDMKNLIKEFNIPLLEDVDKICNNLTEENKIKNINVDLLFKE